MYHLCRKFFIKGFGNIKYLRWYSGILVSQQLAHSIFLTLPKAFSKSTKFMLSDDCHSNYCSKINLSCNLVITISVGSKACLFITFKAYSYTALVGIFHRNISYNQKYVFVVLISRCILLSLSWFWHSFASFAFTFASIM